MTKDSQLEPDKASPLLNWARYHSLATIAAGEGFARVCNLILLIFISRKLGVKVTGAYALAQALALYMSQGIDLGLRHIGAGLVATHPKHIRIIAQLVQRKRLLLTVPVVILGYCYGALGPVPHDTRSLIGFYALSMTGYSFSLDWLAWGLKCFAWMSYWKASVSFLGLALTLLSIHFLHSDMRVIALGNGIGLALSSYVLWRFWGRGLLTKSAITADNNEIRSATSWRPILWMGLAMLANQAFNSLDIVILGSLSNSTQTGLYSAAYRIFLLVLAIYYLALQAMYPQLAATPIEQRSLQTLRPYLAKLALIGIFIAIFMELIRSPLITLLYGPAFHDAIMLATPILLSIPLELLVSFLLTAIIAWGQSRTALIATVIAGTCNATLNLLLIPKFQALGAAYTTPISYGIFLLTLLVCLNRSISRPFSSHTERAFPSVYS